MKQPGYRTSKKDRYGSGFSLPSMGGGFEIGSKAQIESRNHGKEERPEYLFPPSLKHSSNDKNASNRAEQADNSIQQRYDYSANQLDARSSPSQQIVQ